MGYHLAGWDVTAVDNSAARLSRAPFPAIQADAIEYVHEHGHEYDAIHGSPPCTGNTQGNSWMTDDEKDARYPPQIAAFREAVIATGKPYVIENVTSAKARAQLRDPIMLCGTQFGLTTEDEDGTLLHLRRHRLFESNVLLMPPGPCRHQKNVQWAGAYGGARRNAWEAKNVRRGGYVPKSLAVLRSLLGVPWMSEEGVFLCIPPVYTEHLGAQLLDAVSSPRL